VIGQGVIVLNLKRMDSTVSLQLELMIFKVFSNLSNSMIL